MLKKSIFLFILGLAVTTSIFSVEPRVRARERAVVTPNVRPVAAPRPVVRTQRRQNVEQANEAAAAEDRAQTIESNQQAIMDQMQN